MRWKARERKGGRGKGGRKKERERKGGRGKGGRKKERKKKKEKERKKARERKEKEVKRKRKKGKKKEEKGKLKFLSHEANSRQPRRVRNFHYFPLFPIENIKGSIFISPSFSRLHCGRYVIGTQVANTVKVRVPRKIFLPKFQKVIYWINYLAWKDTSVIIFVIVWICG